MTIADCSSLLLAIETAGSRCSTAITRGGAVLASERRELRHGHAEMLLPMIDRATRAAGIAPPQFDAVAVAVGPGGFTGIRVGLAAAQGIAFATGARLVGISSFVAVAAGLPEGAAAGRGPARRALLIALDSRREDFYVQLFAPDREEPLADPVAALPHQLAAYIEHVAGDLPLLIAGDAGAAAAAVLGRPDAVEVVPESAPDALGVAAAARRRLLSGMPAGPVRPLYLRPPDVTLPKRQEPLPVSVR